VACGHEQTSKVLPSVWLCLLIDPIDDLARPADQ
jgi:hypothetical protein